MMNEHLWHLNASFETCGRGLGRPMVLKNAGQGDITVKLVDEDDDRFDLAPGEERTITIPETTTIMARGEGGQFVTGEPIPQD